MMGIYITVDGARQLGKTTLIEGLRQRLEAAGHEVVVVSEPSATETSAHLRKVLRENPGRYTPTAEALIYTAARCQVLEEVVLPALQSGKIVLSENSVISTVAYQGMGMSDGQVELLTELIFPDGLMYDLGFVLRPVSDSKNVSARVNALVQDYDPVVLNAFECSYVHKRYYRSIYPMPADRSADELLEEAWSVVERMVAG